jgi:spoIIIJ-associated protein
MSSYEYEGKNVEQAVKQACVELKLASDEINYEILSHGSSGIFGLVGAKKARILVNLSENTAQAATELIQSGVANTGDIEAAGDHISIAEDSGDRRFYEMPDDPLDLARTVLQRIVASISSDAKISAEANSERIFLEVAGGNAGLLIGKKGQTLEAMQTLVEKIVNKHNNTSNGDRIRVQVDVAGYLETRKANLEKLALRLADKSKRISKPISLGQMSAYDRRIVHLALKDDPGVRTRSRGEGYVRKLVIFPQKNKPLNPPDKFRKPDF